MCRFCRKIALMGLGLILLYLPAVWTAGQLGLQTNVKYIPANYGHSGLRMSEADSLFSVTTPDVLFLGSSHCYRTFDTRIFRQAGLKCMNLGSSNQTPKQTYALLDRYLRRCKPHTVIFEVHPDIMENSGHESAYDIVSNTRIDWPILQMALRQKSMGVFNTLCCSALDRMVRGTPASSNVVTVSTQSGDTSIMSDFVYIDGGYVELTPFCYKPVPLKRKTIAVRNDQAEWLDRCLCLLESNGIRSILVEVPSTRNRYRSYTNHKDFENTINSLISKHHNSGTDFRYCNLNDDKRLSMMLDDTTCFFDDDHLNQHGAEILSNYILQCIL